MNPERIMQFKKIDENNSELLIYGEIRKKNLFEVFLGEDTDEGRISALELSEILDQIDTPNLTVRINSYGGVVSEGLAIYNLLKSYKGNLKTIVDGFACSAASVIFMAGNERIVPESSLLMIHNAWSNAEGDFNALRKAADDLEKITQPSVNIYCSVTGLPENKIKEMMDNETWITSKEALEMKFATSVENDTKINQSFEIQSIRKLIIKNKELEKIIQESSISQNNSLKNDAWASFFNKKN